MNRATFQVNPIWRLTWILLPIAGVTLLLWPAIEWVRSSTHGGRDAPLDTYQVLAVVDDPGSTRYAAIVKYYEASCSTGLTAVWIGSTDAPAVGSTQPLDGSPALISTASISKEQLTWQPDDTLLLSVLAPTEVVPDSATECMNGDDVASAVYVDSGLVEVRLFP